MPFGTWQPFNNHKLRLCRIWNSHNCFAENSSLAGYVMSFRLVRMHLFKWFNVKTKVANSLPITSPHCIKKIINLNCNYHCHIFGVTSLLAIIRNDILIYFASPTLFTFVRDKKVHVFSSVFLFFFLPTIRLPATFIFIVPVFMVYFILFSISSSLQPLLCVFYPFISLLFSP